MKNYDKFQNGLIPPALSILFTAGLLPMGTVSASDQQSNHIGSVDDNDSSEALSVSLLTRTSALWSNPQWQEFKRIWKKLDSIAPADGDYSSSRIEYEELNKIRNELGDSYVELMRIADEMAIDSLDIVLLHRLASDRLDILSYGSALPMTRMMPPPVSDQTDELLPQIEARIDTVLRLREDGLISSGEMITAFSNLRSSIDLYFLLETINSETGYSGVLWTVRWPMEIDRIQPYLDSITTSVRESLRNAGSENEERYSVMLEDLRNMEQSISNVQDRLPSLHELLLDLELF